MDSELWILGLATLWPNGELAREDVGMLGGGCSGVWPGKQGGVILGWFDPGEFGVFLPVEFYGTGTVEARELVGEVGRQWGCTGRKLG